MCNALSTLTGRDYPTWNVQVNVSYPIGGSAAEAQYARGRVQRNQSAAQLRALGEPRVHELLQRARDDVRIRVLQRQDADVTQVEGQVAVERLEQALDDGEAPRIARDDERAGAFI